MATAAPPEPIVAPEGAVYELPDVWPGDWVNVSKEKTMATKQVAQVMERKQQYIVVYVILTGAQLRCYHIDHDFVHSKPQLFKNAGHYIFELSRPTKRLRELEATVGVQGEQIKRLIAKTGKEPKPAKAPKPAKPPEASE